MRRAGFSEDEIREAGVELCNALAMSGGARIFRDGHTAAIFLVHGRYIHVASWDRNSFMYDTSTDGIQ